MRLPPAAPTFPSGQQRARPVRVILANGDPVFVDGLRRLCERQGLLVAGSVTTGGRAVRLIRQLRPDVAVIGLVMPDLNGFDATRQIVDTSPGTRILLLTAVLDQRRLADAWRAGARGVALKTQPPAELVRAIHEVAAGRTYVCPMEESGVYWTFSPARAAPSSLTRRERQVLQLIAEGNTIRQTAMLLGIAAKTVARHRERLRKKLGVHTTAHLVRWAIRLGLVVP